MNQKDEQWKRSHQWNHLIVWIFAESPLIFFQSADEFFQETTDQTMESKSIGNHRSNDGVNKLRIKFSGKLRSIFPGNYESTFQGNYTSQNQSVTIDQTMEKLCIKFSGKLHIKFSGKLNIKFSGKLQESKQIRNHRSNDGVKKLCIKLSRKLRIKFPGKLHIERWNQHSSVTTDQIMASNFPGNYIQIFQERTK